MERETLDALYRQYAGELYLYALSLCKRPELAGELVSDAFFKALLSAEGAGSSFKWWLFRVCKNLWLDRLRRDRRLTGEPPDPARLAVEDRTLETLILKEERRAVYHAVLALPPSLREAVVLRYYADLPVAQVGAALGISPGAARTLLFRARQKLKDRLEGTIP